MKVLFFWLVGSIGLIGTILMPDIQGAGISIAQANTFNFLLRIALINFAILSLLMPYFMKHGYVHPNYYNATRYEKAKSEFTIISTGLPGIIGMSYLAFTTPGVKKGLVILVVVIAAFRYLECIYRVGRGSDQEKKR